MKLPEYKPMPRHIAQDDGDSKDAGAALWLIAGPVVFVLGVGMVVYGLLRMFA